MKADPCADRHRQAGGGRAVAAVAAAAVAGLGIALSGCGGSPAGPPAAGGSTAYQKAVAYAECMRAHGEPGWPDPTSQGGFTFDGQQDHLIGGAQMQSANTACQHLLPNGGRITPVQTAMAVRQLLSFATCMRARGVTDFPDPDGSGNIAAPDSLTNAPRYQSAYPACRKLLPGGGLGG